VEQSESEKVRRVMMLFDDDDDAAVGEEAERERTVAKNTARAGRKGEE
jgi:hypothetical protein